MENAALNALKPYFEPSESALRTAVDVRDVAATPLGQLIVAETEVTGIEGRRIAFKVTRAR